MASIEYYAKAAEKQNELKKMLQGKLTKEISAFIENYPFYIYSMIKNYGIEATVLGFMDAYSHSRPSFSEIENAVKKYSNSPKPEYL